MSAIRQLLRAAKWTSLRYLENSRFGSAVTAARWRWRSASAWERIAGEHPHHALLCAYLREHLTFESVLEIGCGPAHNLLRLAQHDPTVRLAGIDISPHAIRMARTRFQAEGHRATLRTGVAWNLSVFPDHSYDIVLSDACLMYVGPDRIEATLREMVRVARIAIVLHEWNCETQSGSASRYVVGHWAHDFRALLGQLPSLTTIQTDAESRSWWTDACWRQYGTITFALLRASA